MVHTIYYFYVTSFAMYNFMTVQVFRKCFQQVVFFVYIIFRTELADKGEGDKQKENKSGPDNSSHLRFL